MIFSATQSPTPDEALSWLDAVQQAGFVGLLILLVAAFALGYIVTRKGVETMNSGLVEGQREKDAAHKVRVEGLVEQRDYYKGRTDQAETLVESLSENETILLRQIAPVLTKFFGEATFDRGAG